MLILITGGVKNGKSMLGEDICVRISTGKKCYIATMYRNPDDDEVTERINRHRQMRLKKGFTTLEKCTAIHELPLSSFDTAIIECIPNLLANEMFMSNNIEDTAKYICESIFTICKIIKNVVVISNEVGCDGLSYSKETMQYIKQLGQINSSLAKQADEVYEVVCGIPIKQK